MAKAGETLESIAASFHANVSSLAAYNDVSAAKPIEHTTLLSNSFAFGGLNAVLVARAW